MADCAAAVRALELAARVAGKLRPLDDEARRSRTIAKRLHEELRAMTTPERAAFTEYLAGIITGEIVPEEEIISE